MNTPCPECGSTNVAGLMEAFWTELEDDEPKQNWFLDARSCTELTMQRSCGDCGHEWEVES